MWQDEWEAVSQRFECCDVDTLECINRKWSTTDCYFGGSFGIPVEDRFRIDRPYFRVDRFKLRDALTNHDSYQIVKGSHESMTIGTNVYAPMGSLTHGENGSTIKLSDGSVVNAKIIVDCTGHESKLITKNPDDIGNVEAGYQIAYGVTVNVEPIDENKVSFHDVLTHLWIFLNFF